MWHWDGISLPLTEAQRAVMETRGVPCNADTTDVVPSQLLTSKGREKQ